MTTPDKQATHWATLLTDAGWRVMPPTAQGVIVALRLHDDNTVDSLHSYPNTTATAARTTSTGETVWQSTGWVTDVVVDLLELPRV